jgi:ABC-type transport system involved in multi-copper enzyme maturation permease subunit
VNAILNIARWEWFKLQRRKMPWILLAILFAFSQLAVLGSYARYGANVATGGTAFIQMGAGGGGGPFGGSRRNCNEILADPAGAVPEGLPPAASSVVVEQCRRQSAALATTYRSLSAAGSVSSTLGLAASLGLILFGILAASVVGLEFGLGTLRPILARGTGRLAFAAGKYLMLVATSTAGLLLVCAAAAGTGQLVHAGATPPPGTAAAVESLATMGLPLLKTWYAMLTYLTMAGAATLLLRSTAAGMGISLAWYVAEPILIRLLSQAFEDFQKVADYLPMRNISSLTSSGRAGLANIISGGGANVSTLHASLVMAAWLLAFAVAAALVFRGRDVTGARGG